MHDMVVLKFCFYLTIHIVLTQNDKITIWGGGGGGV